MTAFLSINSEDFVNDFAIVQLSIDIVKTTPYGQETKENILFSQASIKNGRLFLLGNGFTASDFEVTNLEKGVAFGLNTDHKVLQLDSNIDEDMDIEITITSDVGNILDGQSEIEKNNISMDVAYNIATNNIIVDINHSQEETNGVIEVMDINGITCYQIKITSLTNNTIEIHREAISNLGNHFIIVLRLTDGQVLSRQIITP